MPAESTRISGGAGIYEVVRLHEKRLDRIEDAERQMIAELGEIKKAIDRCERPLRNISKATWSVAGAFLAFIVVAVLKMFTLRVPPAPDVPWPGERLGSDRIQHPAPPKSEP